MKLDFNFGQVLSVQWAVENQLKKMEKLHAGLLLDGSEDAAAIMKEISSLKTVQEIIKEAL